MDECFEKDVLNMVLCGAHSIPRIYWKMRKCSIPRKLKMVIPRNKLTSLLFPEKIFVQVAYSQNYLCYFIALVLYKFYDVNKEVCFEEARL